MTPPTFDRGRLLPTRNRARLLALLIIFAGIMVAVGGGLYAIRSLSPKKPAPTMVEITEIAKKTPLNDRKEWLKLARAALAGEKVQPIAPPRQPINNRGNATRIELGYLLFFDPILSGDQTTACASCHHPAYGLADGLRKGVGV